MATSIKNVTIPPDPSQTVLDKRRDRTQGSVYARQQLHLPGKCLPRREAKSRPSTSRRAGEQPLWDFPENTLAGREVCAYLVSQALGFGIVPFTLLRDGPLGPGSLQQYIDHDPNYHYFTFKPAEIERLRPVVLFDLLVNNADRKGSHILVQKRTRKLYLIDHGLCFHVEDKLRTVIWDFAGEPIPADLLAALASFRARIGTCRPCWLRISARRKWLLWCSGPRRSWLPGSSHSRPRTGVPFLSRRSNPVFSVFSIFLFPLALRLSQEFRMPHYNLALLGFGNVGRALARLLQRKEAELQSRYDITFSVTGIATGRHGAAINPAGLDYIRAAELVEAGESLAALSKIPIQDNSDFLRACGSRCVVREYAREPCDRPACH